jgi:hypothetical protein
LTLTLVLGVVVSTVLTLTSILVLGVCWEDRSEEKRGDE